MTILYRLDVLIVEAIRLTKVEGVSGRHAAHLQRIGVLRTSPSSKLGSSITDASHGSAWLTQFYPKPESRSASALARKAPYDGWTTRRALPMAISRGEPLSGRWTSGTSFVRRVKSEASGLASVARSGRLSSRRRSCGQVPQAA